MGFPQALAILHGVILTCYGREMFINCRRNAGCKDNNNRCSFFNSLSYQSPMENETFYNFMYTKGPVSEKNKLRSRLLSASLLIEVLDHHEKNGPCCWCRLYNCRQSWEALRTRFKIIACSVILLLTMRYLVLYRIILYYIVRCHTVLYYIVLWHTLLYHVLLFQNNLILHAIAHHMKSVLR